MRTTFKAIARMAGYQALYYPLGNCETEWVWVQVNKETQSLNWFVKVDDCHGVFKTEQEAYEDCCRVCGLVEFEEGDV